MIHGTDTTAVVSGMNLRINVQLPKGLLKADEFDRLLAKYTPQIAAEARDFWIAEAGRQLQSSKQIYQDAIMLEGVGSGVGMFTLVLSDPLASAVELGAEGFDMKPGLVGKIVPMNLGRQNPFSYTPTFRTATQEGKWRHPGWEGRNIRDQVIEEVMNVIIPKYVQKIVIELIA